jgi:predicted nucleotidyltransferase
MLSNILDDILGPHSKVSVLRVLFLQDSLSGREVARRAGLSPRAASLALTELVKVGILNRHAAGATHLFAVNRHRHLVHAALGALFSEEAGLPGAMGREILRAIGENRCDSIALFGSYARGEGASHSDLDVLVLLKDAREALRVKRTIQEHGEKFSDLFGLRLSPYVIGTAEFKGRFRKGDELMRSMVREARVVAGKPLAEVMMDDSKETKH